MNLIELYLKQRKRGILFFVLCTVIFSGTFYLYSLPVQAVLYPALVCAVLGIGFFLWDIRGVKLKHKRLEKIRKQSPELMEKLPEIRTPDDEDYQAVITGMCQKYQQIQTEMSLKYQDMVDYYTIWAHQIKTPIASMRLNLQNEDSSVSRQLSEDLQRIEQYVEMVLAFLRLGSSAKDYVFREQELDTIIKDAAKKFASQFIRRKIRLCYEPVHVKVLTDEKWLSFVIEQVLSNALKYTNSGSITIEMEQPMTLCIRDTGIGIAPEDIPRVFEKSYTGYNGRRDKKASGIGLYLCKQICNNLGHGISLQSSLDNGTVVRICLDRREWKVE